LHFGRFGPDKQARELALQGASTLFRKFHTAAQAAGERNPRNLAREQTAKIIRRRMKEHGVKPPSIPTIMKWNFGTSHF
jgi:hypothetical protein